MCCGEYGNPAMRTKILCCRTLEPEVRLAMEKCGCNRELQVLHDSNHDVPNRLRSCIQEILDDMKDVDRVLLAFTTCGGAMVGLRAGDFELVIPRVDDCLSLLMGSMERRQKVLEGGFGLFVTRSWLENEHNTIAQLEYIRNKYPAPRANKIIETMYGHFNSLNVIDTGAYDVPSILPQTQQIARQLNLKHRVIQGTLSYLEELLQGPYDPSQFIIIQPRTAVREYDTLLKPCIYTK